MRVSTAKNDEKKFDGGQRGCYFPRRYMMALLGFFGMFNVYAMRVNLSVAMVAMANSTKNERPMDPNVTIYEKQCPSMMSLDDLPNGEEYKGPQYNWDTKTQGLILGSFFYGYVLTQIPGGFGAQRFGAKWLFGGGVLVTAVFTLLTPLAAGLGVPAFVTVRILEGLGEGVTFPAMTAAISRWAPRLERSRVSTFVFTGAQLGNVVAMPISGWLCSSDLLGGWPSVFYVFGTVGCVWFILWAVFIHETPDEHPTISKAELFYFHQHQDQVPLKRPPTPWKAIVTSLPLWAVLVAHIGHHFGFLILLTELPSYLSSVLHFDIKQNGLLSALPYVVQAVSAWIAAYIADKLRASGRLSITTIRKICNSIGLYGPAVCLLLVPASGCHAYVIVALISAALALNGFIYSGLNVTHVDMSPVFSGTLFGITSGISNLCGIIGPAVVGVFTADGSTISGWNNVLYITVAVYTVTATFYAIFASAELQPWGRGVRSQEDELVKVVSTVRG